MLGAPTQQPEEVHFATPHCAAPYFIFSSAAPYSRDSRSHVRKVAGAHIEVCGRSQTSEMLRKTILAWLAWRSLSTFPGLWVPKDRGIMATILCLDDHTRHLVSRIDRLQANGYTVLCAADPSAAFELFAHNSIDAVMLDCHMDAIDGFVTALRMTKSSVPIIMLSGYCSAPCHLSQKADACIQKGDDEGLLQTLERIIRLARYELLRSVPICWAA
jgi:CheY-like chemotaxis protein